MKHCIYSTIIVIAFAACTEPKQQGFGTDAALDYCHEQVARTLDALQPIDFSMMPRNILDGDTVWNLRKAKLEEWCSGFWAGILWMDYTATGDETIRQAAEEYTKALIPVTEAPVYDHDLGFITINSILKGYEATGNEQYREIALHAADSLSTLFNPTVGTILSWPRHVKDYGGHNTIMDNMMNLELLFWAAENGGSGHLKEIAMRHAETTMQHHFREDGSCYHVVVYDTLDGHFIKGMTHQGYADSSMWSRGQSWAIYGYTMVYRFTRDKRFLDFAQKVTDIYLKRLCETSDDWIPLWDMDFAVDDNEEKREKSKDKNEIVNSSSVKRRKAPSGKSLNCKYKDASAACVVASALLELCQYVDKEKGKTYREAAISILRDLSTDRYQSRSRNVAFLMHSTGHHPAGSEIDASIIYADYYYLEALCKLNAIELARDGRGAAKGL